MGDCKNSRVMHDITVNVKTKKTQNHDKINMLAWASTLAGLQRAYN